MHIFTIINCYTITGNLWKCFWWLAKQFVCKYFYPQMSLKLIRWPRKQSY